LPAAISSILLSSGSIIVCLLVGTGKYVEELILRQNVVFAYDEIIFYFISFLSWSLFSYRVYL
jgi:hypothetical protein